MKKAIILSSGGVDSTTCLSVAVNALGAENVSTASIFYGQKHKKELDAARAVAAYYHVPHYEFDLAQIMQYSNCSLLSHSTESIVHKSYGEQIAEKGAGKVSTYVPFRNGLMISVAASLAAGIYEEEETDIYVGAHGDDAAGEAYADCSPRFLKAMREAVAVGTYGKVHLVFPFADKNKTGVVAEGLKLGTPYELTWSCYEGGDTRLLKTGWKTRGMEGKDNMFTVTKRMEISGAHFLRLNYESKCTSMHGHNWIVTVTVQNDKLDENGMVVDFTKIKDVVNLFDHRCANDIMEGLNPTAENMAKWLCDRIPHCIRVAVQETEGNTAVYEK